MRIQIRKTGGKKLKKSEFWPILAPALFKAFSHNAIIAAFDTCGIWPPNVEKLEEAQMLPATVTAWEQQVEQAEKSSEFIAYFLTVYCLFIVCLLSVFLTA